MSYGKHDDFNSIDAFTSQYDKVFDENDSTLLVGRDECSKLIGLAYVVDPSDEGKYGNHATGMMNLDSISGLHKMLRQGRS